MSVSAVMPGAGPEPLPSLLREDLQLFESTPDANGERVWTIQDPITNRFYRIGWLEFECLLRWPGSAAEIAADIAANTPLAADADQVEAFGRFLGHHNLLRLDEERRERMLAKLNEPGWRHWRWWLHHYLFVRVPLVRPERGLAAMLPWVRPLGSSLGLSLIVLVSVLGLLLVARQWDTFTHSVLDIFTPTGIMGFALALIISKALHELGHALVATHLGLRVSHMGVAFLVLWPMLYTDTGESWRLRTHRERLIISTAGMAVELALAGLSTLAWALLDDGPLRQATLYLATTGWVLSLALNASPFMRFDGYFILSDLIGFPNLHERARAAAKTGVRRVLLGWDEPYAEVMPPRQRRSLIAFALATWLYRLTVFLAIAVAVYFLFFKVLGIFLMIVELVWFVVRPISTELAVWRKRWSETSMNRRRGWALVLLAALVALFFPWARDVKLAGVAHPERQQFVYAPVPAQVLELNPEGEVQQGALLVRFDAPDLQGRMQRAQAAAYALDQRLAGLGADVNGIEQHQVTIARLREQLREAQAVDDETARLGVRADFNGRWVDVDPLIGPGAWVGTRDLVGVLVDPQSWVVDAYVDQRDVQRIRVGAKARFRWEGELTTQEATVLGVDTARSQRLLYPMLAAPYGGTVAVLQEGKEALPAEALYRVRLALKASMPALRELRGQVSIEGPRQSLPWELLKRGAAVLVRESGF